MNVLAIINFVWRFESETSLSLRYHAPGPAVYDFIIVVLDIILQGCRKVMKSGRGQHFGLCFISCSLHLLGGLGAYPPENCVL